MDIHTEFPALKSLDPTAEGDFPVDDAALAALAEITGSPSSSADAEVVALPRRRRSGRRLAVLAAAAVLLAVAGVVVPMLHSTPVSTVPTAWGSWRPAPKEMTRAQLREAVKDCRELAADTAKSEGFTIVRVRLTERRGGAALVVFGDAGNQVLGCLTGKSNANGTGSVVGRPSDLAADGLSDAGGFGSPGSPNGIWPLTVAFGFVGKDVTAVTVRVSTGLTVRATVTDGLFAVSYPDDGSHRRTYVLTLRDGRTVKRDYLDELYGSDLRPTMQLAPAKRLTHRQAAVDRTCRRQLDFPKRDHSSYRAGTPYATTLGTTTVLYYLTTNGRSGWCTTGGTTGTLRATKVLAGSISPIGGTNGGNHNIMFGLAGRDVRAVTVHFSGGRKVSAKLRDSLFSYTERTSDRVAYYTVTRKDGSVIRVKGY